MKVKRLTRAIFTLAATGSLVLASFAPSSALDLINPGDPYQGQGYGINLVDNYINNGHQASVIYGRNFDGNQFKGDKNCSDIKSCNFADFSSIQGNLLLPGCTASDKTDCLAALEVFQDGSWKKTEYVGQAPGPKIDGDEKLGLPNSGGVSLWKLPAENPANVRFFAAHLDLDVNWMNNIGAFNPVAFDLTVLPYEIKLGSYRVPDVSEFSDGSGMTRVRVGGFPGECAWVSQSECGKIIEFDTALKIRTTLNVPKEIGGWLVGRVSNPEVNIVALDKRQAQVSVAGEVVPVPKIYVVTSKQEGADAVKRAFNSQDEIPTGLRNIKANQPGALGALEAFRELAKDSSVGDYSVWSFGTSQMNSNCSRSNPGFQGFASTNASYYQASPPAFSSGYLNYIVAGYHFGPDGKTANLGRYDLLMTTKFAKCLYGFKRVPKYASVRIATDGGASSASTTTLTEKKGWLKLAASGFTFSTKTIKVKLK